MKIVLSPAKSLDFETAVPTQQNSQPIFLKQAQKLNSVLEKKSKKAIGDLMSISDKLAALNYQRYKDFNTPFTEDNARQAVYAFSGDVYQGLDAYSIPQEKIKTLNNTLFILSGMYGLLKPLDLIQPYRLEMGTSLKVGGKSNLYQFWGDQVTQALNEVLKDDELFLNLASNEYFKVINVAKLKVPVIAPVFKDFKNGKLKVISFYAKKARGSMTRYCVDTNAATLEDVKGFNYDGYAFSEEYTQKQNEPVFVR